MSCSLHRGTQSYCWMVPWWSLCGGRMYYPKTDYLEKVKAITSNF